MLALVLSSCPFVHIRCAIEFLFNSGKRMLVLVLSSCPSVHMLVSFVVMHCRGTEILAEILVLFGLSLCSKMLAVIFFL